MGEQELRARLLDFDRAAALLHPGRRFRLVLVGGSAMVLLGRLERATHDLDALVFPTELLELMESFDISARVAAYADQFAYHLEDRLVPLDLGTTTVDCFVASLEDLVASKLYSDRPVDAADVRRPEVLARLDWDLLGEAAADMERSHLVQRRYREFLSAYDEYRRECEPCAD